jgi:hypothetical protein
MWSSLVDLGFFFKIGVLNVIFVDLGHFWEIVVLNVIFMDLDQLLSPPPRFLVLGMLPPQHPRALLNVKH